MEKLQYVGFWQRLLAAVLDFFLFMLLTGILLRLASSSDYMLVSGILDERANFFIVVVVPVFIVITFWKMANATPGKMAIGAKIVDVETGNAPSFGQYVGRYAAYFLALIPACLGIIWIGFDRKKRGWHDKLAGTVVVRIDKASVADVSPAAFLSKAIAHPALTVFPDMQVPGGGSAIESAKNQRVSGDPVAIIPRKFTKLGLITINFFIVILLWHVMSANSAGDEKSFVSFFATIIFLWFLVTSILGIFAIFTKINKRKIRANPGSPPEQCLSGNDTVSKSDQITDHQEKPAIGFFRKSIIWGFIGFNFFIFFLLQRITGDVKGTVQIGTVIYCIIIFGIWGCGSAILGIFAFFTRKK